MILILCYRYQNVVVLSVVDANLNRHIEDVYALTHGQETVLVGGWVVVVVVTPLEDQPSIVPIPSWSAAEI